MCLRYVDAGRREYKQENTGHICQGNTLAWLTAVPVYGAIGVTGAVL